MSWWRDLIFGKRDATPTMVGFTYDSGVTSGVNATTTLGLSAVWRCIDILSNGVSQLEWREREGMLDLAPSRLVVRPQAQRTRREWTSLVVSTLALYDVCYLFKAGGTDADGVPMGLWYVDPTLVGPVTTDLFTSAFLLPPDEYFVAQQKVPRDALVVLHRSPQPTISDTAGGIINLARTTFAAAIAAERYASRYWQSGGTPNTVLETDQRLTPVQMDQASDAWAEKRARGPERPPVLAGGIKARSMGADPTSESAVEARRELVADIGRYFGVPTRILNAPTGDSETYTSTPAANSDLVRYTLQNYIGAIEDGISDVLPPPRRMEMSTRKLTAGTQYEQAQTFQLATGGRAWMTPGEARDAIGLPPIASPVHLLALGGSLSDQVAGGLITDAEARDAMDLPPIDWGDALSTVEHDQLMAEAAAGIRTEDEVRAVLKLPPMAWSDDISPDESTMLIAQVQAGLRTTDEARAVLKLPPMTWSEDLTTAEIDSLIAQVNAGLLTTDEARALMKLAPMDWSAEPSSDTVATVVAQVTAGLLTLDEARTLLGRPVMAYDEGPSPDTVASIITQVHEGLLTSDEARALLGREPIEWPEDLTTKVSQAGEFIKAGFEPGDTLAVLGLPPIAHLGLPPITVQKLADAAGVAPAPGAPPPPDVVASNGRSPV